MQHSDHALIIDALANIQTPAYVADVAAIKCNMAVAARLKALSNCQIVLATKAFALPAAFPYMRDVLDGTTASGLYEAKLGAQHFGKTVHTYSPAFTQQTLVDCLEHSSHIYFNSTAQLRRFAAQVRSANKDASIGLRVNPRLSLVKNSELYNPSSPASRFGVQPQELTPDVLAQIDTLHVHNLCENDAADSIALINHLRTTMPEALSSVSALNLGGGHYITQAGYKLETLASALKSLAQDFDLQIILEPGGALVYEAGYLVASVLDMFENAHNQVIIDASASTHMPDVLEVPYRPHIIGSGEAGEKAHTYKLGGNTCMTGDIIGDYSFDQPLNIGDKLIFTDMIQYSFVKNNTFNGVPLPDLALLHEDGHYEIVQQFGYHDFAKRLGTDR